MRPPGPMRQPVFFRFAVTYLALLIVPLTACLYIYSSAAGIIQENVYESHMSAMEQNIERIDKELENIDDVTNILQVNLAVNDYIQS